MRPARACVLALALLLPGCEPTPDPASMTPVADTKQLMAAVLEPAAEVYWDAVGTVLDETGTREWAPTTGEEWEAVRNAAFVLAESGNLLMVEGRAVDGDGWMAMSRALVEVGRRAIAAAEARDPGAVFTVGGDVYEACTACHAAYAIETLRPSDTRR